VSSKPKSWISTLADKVSDVLTAALIAVDALALVDGMLAYNDTKLSEFEDNEVEYVEWVCHPEMTATGTCEFCDSMEGTVFELGSEPDFPAHVRCVCEFAPVESPSKVMSPDDYTSYEDWRSSNKALVNALMLKWVAKSGVGSGH
jgi:hypothetical protein